MPQTPAENTGTEITAEDVGSPASRHTPGGGSEQQLTCLSRNPGLGEQTPNHLPMVMQLCHLSVNLKVLLNTPRAGSLHRSDLPLPLWGVTLLTSYPGPAQAAGK